MNSQEFQRKWAIDYLVGHLGSKLVADNKVNEDRETIDYLYPWYDDAVYLDDLKMYIDECQPEYKFKYLGLLACEVLLENNEDIK